MERCAMSVYGLEVVGGAQNRLDDEWHNDLTKEREDDK